MEKFFRGIGISSSSGGDVVSNTINGVNDSEFIDEQLSDEESLIEQKDVVETVNDVDNDYCFFTANSRITNLCMTKNGEDFYITTQRGFLEHRNVSNPYKVIKRYKTQTKYVKTLKLTESCDSIMLGFDNILLLLKTNDFSLISSYIIQENDKIMCCCTCLEMKKIFVGSYNGYIKGFDLRTGEEFIPFKVSIPQHKQIVHKLVVFRGTLFSAGQDKCIRQWNIVTGELISTIWNYTPVLDFKFSDESNWKNCNEILIQDFTSIQICDLKKENNEGYPKMVDILNNEHFIDYVTCFDVLSDTKAVIMWNRKTGHIQIYDIATHQIVWEKKIEGVLIARNLTSDYNAFMEFQDDFEKFQKMHSNFFIYFLEQSSLRRIKIDRKWLWNIQTELKLEFEKEKEKKQEESFLEDDFENEENPDYDKVKHYFHSMLIYNRENFYGFKNDTKKNSEDSEDKNVPNLPKKRKSNILKKLKEKKRKEEGKDGTDRYFYDNGNQFKNKKFVIKSKTKQ